MTQAGVRAAVAVACVMASGAVYAQAPAIVPVQGVLTDSAGMALEGQATVVFTIYDGPTTDAMVMFTESQQVSLEQGAFVAYLGADIATPLDMSLFRDARDLYIGIQVNTDPEMLPRLRVGSVPFAGFASYCGDATTLDGQTAASFLPANYTPTWSELRDVPAGLADGDDDTLYTAGTGLSLTGTEFSLNYTPAWGDLSGVPADLADGDDDTTYTAGAGVTLTGGAFSIDQGYTDGRYVNEGQANSVTGAMITDSTVTASDLASNSVGAAEIATNAVGAAEIAANAVGRSELAGTEVAVYVQPKGCQSAFVTTTNFLISSNGSAPSCPTVACNFVSPIRYFDCGGTCGSLTASRNCTASVILGYLVAP